MDNGNGDEKRDNPATGTPPVESPPEIEQLPEKEDGDNGDEAAAAAAER